MIYLNETDDLMPNAEVIEDLRAKLEDANARIAELLKIEFLSSEFIKKCDAEITQDNVNLRAKLKAANALIERFMYALILFLSANTHDHRLRARGIAEKLLAESEPAAKESAQESVEKVMEKQGWE
jgi:hypothetical protein